MLLQKRRQLFRVEILTGYGALKHFFNSPVPVVVPQPDTDRHRKSQLFPRGRVFRDVFPGHLPKQILRLSVGKFCLRRKCPGSLEHIPVQEGHAHLQRMGHAHAVGFLQNIPGQPVFQVDVLHFLRVGKPGGFFISLSQKLLTGRRVGRIFQKLPALLVGENMGVPDKPFLHPLAGPDQKALAAAVRQFFRLPGNRTPDLFRNPGHFLKSQRLPVDIITAK